MHFRGDGGAHLPHRTRTKVRLRFRQRPARAKPATETNKQRISLSILYFGKYLSQSVRCELLVRVAGPQSSTARRVPQSGGSLLQTHRHFWLRPWTIFFKASLSRSGEAGYGFMEWADKPTTNSIASRVSIDGPPRHRVAAAADLLPMTTTRRVKTETPPVTRGGVVRGGVARGVAIAAGAGAAFGDFLQRRWRGRSVLIPTLFCSC